MGKDGNEAETMGNDDAPSVVFVPIDGNDHAVGWSQNLRIGSRGYVNAFMEFPASVEGNNPTSELCAYPTPTRSAGRSRGGNGRPGFDEIEERPFLLL
jgi:hypothetical protein